MTTKKEEPIIQYTRDKKIPDQDELVLERDSTDPVPSIPTEPKARDESESHFRWDDELVVVRGQPAIAVYTNPYGGVVIRQGETYPYDDQWVHFAPEHADAIIQAILTAVRGDR
jgi:hypothetical protein